MVYWQCLLFWLHLLTLVSNKSQYSLRMNEHIWMKRLNECKHHKTVIIIKPFLFTEKMIWASLTFHASQSWQQHNSNKIQQQLVCFIFLIIYCCCCCCCYYFTSLFAHAKRMLEKIKKVQTNVQLLFNNNEFNKFSVWSCSLVIENV